MKPITFTYEDFMDDTSLLDKLYNECTTDEGVAKLQMVRWFKYIKQIGLKETKDILDLYLANKENPELTKIALDLSNLTGKDWYLIYRHLKNYIKE